MDSKQIAKRHKKAKLKALKEAQSKAEEPEEVQRAPGVPEEEKVASAEKGDEQGDKYFSGTKFSQMNLSEPTLKSLA
jgi:hypothetical protein